MAAAAAAARAVPGRLCGALLPLPRPLPLPRRGLSGRPAGTLARGGRSSQNARPRREPGIPRTEKMEVDQDWTSVYPAAAAFKPSAVPLPVRMGYPVKRGVPPAKEGNLELLKVKLSSLNLDDHAKKKLIKLVGERYCKGTDTLTITTDRCPLKRQNYDYGVYLLTVLFHESWKTEHWEGEKTVADMEEYVWEDSPSESHALATLSRIRSAEEAKEASREELLASPLIQEYRKSVVVLKNEGETEKNICDYKNSVKRLLNLNAL